MSVYIMFFCIFICQFSVAAYITSIFLLIPSLLDPLTSTPSFVLIILLSFTIQIFLNYLVNFGDRVHL